MCIHIAFIHNPNFSKYLLLNNVK
uniref:Uncharacterized protein n=1 Tax=Anguilla anguilla TaxID=7936 RepID=A0A0E9TWB1_ANGAN